MQTKKLMLGFHLPLVIFCQSIDQRWWPKCQLYQCRGRWTLRLFQLVNSYLSSHGGHALTTEHIDINGCCDQINGNATTHSWAKSWPLAQYLAIYSKTLYSRFPSNCLFLGPSRVNLDFSMRMTLGIMCGPLLVWLVLFLTISWESNEDMLHRYMNNRVRL